LLALTGTGHAADELFPDKILVKGDGFEIKQSQLDQAYMQRKSQMAAAGQNIPESARPMVERQTLDLLILKHLLLKKATPEDRAEAAKIVESQISLAPEGSLSSQARLLGLTDEAFKKELVDQNSAQRVVAREFEPKAVVTERKFYNENLNKFEQPEMVRAAHVLFLTKTEQGADLPEAAVKEKRAAAEKVLERARKGEDFAALAKEFSEDPGSKDSGGEYTFPRGQMVPEFEKTAFEQKPGQISDLVTTGFGFHIIKTLEKIPPMVQEFTEAGRKDPKLEILDERFKS
jgi:parvulin-like peptidyl-prolyl isomerase